jgi:hypothetical protein
LNYHLVLLIYHLVLLIYHLVLLIYHLVLSNVYCVIRYFLFLCFREMHFVFLHSF